MGINAAIQREVVLHLTFAGFFVAGLFASDRLADWTRSAPVSAWFDGTTNAVFQEGTRTTATATGHQEPESQETGDPVARVRALEKQRIASVRKVAPAVVSVFGLERQGGGSGVIIHPSGLALTNHHVVAACGIEGWGGLDDGQLYPWRLVGNDPGGDLALIQLTGRDSFPFVQLGDSDQVEVGDWTLVMGNPFTLAEDYSPTVTHGVVSGTHRYQPGMADLLLVYGDCIQVDTSINPGNSGGPLFDMQGRLLGINGRASFDFQSRGRVNVGLGYAISVNQCRRFLPELMASKLVQHGTLDAVFQDRDGKVLCVAIYEDSLVGELGLALGDELLEFEGKTITSANQYTNLLCTLPADWPAHLKLRRADGTEYQIASRLLGLPYPRTAKAAIEPKPAEKEPGVPPRSVDPEDLDRAEGQEEKNQEEPAETEPPADVEASAPSLKERIADSKKQLGEFLQRPPGVPQFPEVNQQQARLLLERWMATLKAAEGQESASLDTLPPEEVWQIRETVTLPDESQFEITFEFDQRGDRSVVVRPIRTSDELTEAERQKWNAGWRLHGETWNRGYRNPQGDWIWEPATASDALGTTLGIQLWLTRQWLTHSPEDYRLDGAGEVNGQLAVRLVGGPYRHYIWLALDDWTGAPQSWLLRSAEDTDGRFNLGATHYQKWEPLRYGWWPVGRTLNLGLFEDPGASFELRAEQVIARNESSLAQQPSDAEEAAQ